ncbi:MAG: hypothetical protein ACM3IJ_01595, partial [Candidatus Levyibacteriota bacterium]
PEVIHSPSNGRHSESAGQMREISSFPVLHVANNHLTGIDVPSLEPAMMLPVMPKAALSGGETTPKKQPDSQISFDRVMYRLMRGAESDVDYLKGRLLIEGVIFAIPEHPDEQIQLQPAHKSDVFEGALEAVSRRSELRRTVNQERLRMEEQGMDGKSIGKAWGVGEESIPQEIKDHPGLLDYALEVLEMHKEIFLNKDKDGRERALNSVYKKAVELAETQERLGRVNLAADVTAKSLGLKRSNYSGFSQGRQFPKVETQAPVKPLDGQIVLPLGQEVKDWKGRAKDFLNGQVLRRKKQPELYGKLPTY